MASIELTQIESIAKRFESESLVVEFVRGILLPQNRGVEAIKVLNRVYDEIQSSFRARKPSSPIKVLLWALSGLELGELGARNSRTEEGFFFSRVERTLEQICDDRAPGLTVSSSGLLNSDLPELTSDSPRAFEIQCIWINTLFLLGKKRPKWIVLQQLASASFLQTYFPEDNGGECIADHNDGNFQANRILAMGHFPCVLLPYDLARQVLDEFTNASLADAETFDRLYLPALAEAQNRILGETNSKVVAIIQEIQKESASSLDSNSTVAEARLAIELERWSEKEQDNSFEIAQLKRRRQLSISDANSIRSATETVEHAIESTIGQHVSQLSVAIEGHRVVVKATVPSYYVRQLVEHTSRSIVVKHLRKQFVSNVIVERKGSQ